MATVSDDSGILLTALMTPPHNLTLYATGNMINQEALSCLVDGLIAYDIPGVMTEKTLAESFAQAYASRKGLPLTTFMSQRIYELQAVPTPDHFVPLLYVLGVSDEDDKVSVYNKSCELGSLTMTAYLWE